MSKTKANNCERYIARLLKKTSLTWSVDTVGKHRKLYIEGEMVLVFSQGPTKAFDMGRLRNLIRRKQDEKK